VAQLSGLSVPSPGEYDLKVWLEDEAGNVDPDNASDPVKLRFDDVAPGRAEPKRRNGWVGAAEAANYEQRVVLANNDAEPASGIAGYSLTSDGSDPDPTPETATDTYVFTDLPEGLVTIKARAVSGSGLISSEVGSTEVKVDKTPPTVEVVDAPEPDRWLQQPIVLGLKGTDQPGLSGLDPAPSDDAVSKGGYIAFRLDGGELRRIRGATADVGVASDGLHSLVYHAVDVAGNESPERTVDFRIDATAPEELAFEPQDPADPRRLTAVAVDRTSGVTGGAIEIRRSGQTEWSSLATIFEADRLSAYLNDTALERGIYEFRARATDTAGNERGSDRRRDGAKMELSNPVRADTRIVATISPAGRAKASRRDGARRTQVRFGAAALVRGRVMQEDGQGLGEARVFVATRPQSLGATFRPVADVRTDANGYFDVRIPAGSSRSVRLAYDGDATNGPSARFVAVRVPASSTLRVSHARVRNGARVYFSGRLLGRPLPPGGKLIEVQAYFRDEWRTFKTVRTRRRGHFRVPYRFGATTTLVRYLFRVRVSRDASYPYEEGDSPQVVVVVDGRRRR